MVNRESGQVVSKNFLGSSLVDSVESVLVVLGGCWVGVVTLDLFYHNKIR